MAYKDASPAETALESVVEHLGELATVLGAATVPVLDAVRAGLIAAMAARDRGDRPAAIQHIGAAMAQLATLAEQIGPGEQALMLGLAQQVRNALLTGDTAEARRAADVMFRKSGAVERER